MGEQDGELDVCLVSRSFLDSSVSTSRKRDEEHNSVPRPVVRSTRNAKLLGRVRTAPGLQRAGARCHRFSARA